MNRSSSVFGSEIFPNDGEGDSILSIEIVGLVFGHSSANRSSYLAICKVLVRVSKRVRVVIVTYSGRALVPTAQQRKSM